MLVIRGLAFLCLLLSARADLSEKLRELPPPDSLFAPLQAATDESGGPGTPAADSLRGPRSLAFDWSPFAADSTHEWLPAPRIQPARPVEDLADEIQLLHLGPLYDQAQTGQRLLLALDGLDPRESAILLDGVDLSSRITGQSDLNLLSLEELDPGRSAWWNRRGDHAAGSLELSALRAESDSIVTRIRWQDGFLGFVRVEGDFQRPVFGGRMLMGAGQTWTHERVPGAAFRGNSFYWNLDRPLAPNLLLRFDQRILHNKHNLLELAPTGRRSHDLSLNRLRLQMYHSRWDLVELDLWQLEQREGISRTSTVKDSERIRALGLSLCDTIDDRSWRGSMRVEQLRLSRNTWLLRDTRIVGSAGLIQQLNGWNGRLDKLELSGDLSSRKDLSGLPFNGSMILSGHQGWLQGELLFQAGRRHPHPEMLYLERDPALRDRLVSPWLREAGLSPEPDYDTSMIGWLRQELRLSFPVDLVQPVGVQLRGWRVMLKDQPVEVIQQGATEEDLAVWQRIDHVQSGLQLFLNAKLQRRLKANLAISHFADSKSVVSREYPTSMVDFWLEGQRWFFGRELEVLAWLGAHQEHGGLDSSGNALWEVPELWFKLSARKGPFTLWWSLRNPWGLTDASRVEGLPLPGHEEILGIRWSFIN
jgi:hypothetical protein